MEITQRVGLLAHVALCSFGSVVEEEAFAAVRAQQSLENQIFPVRANSNYVQTTPDKSYPENRTLASCFGETLIIRCT